MLQMLDARIFLIFTKPWFLLLLALALVVVSWVAAQVFDRGDNHRTMTRYLLAKGAPLALFFLGLGTAAVGVAMYIIGFGE